MDINWYPGHMAKAKRLLADQLSRVDVVVELCDARLPYSSRNPDLDKLLAGKKRVLLLNKADLADPAATSAWLNYFRAQGIDAAPYSASTGKAKDALAVIDRAAKEAVERAAQKGIRKTVKAMVVGVPNVGKSTILSVLTSAKPKIANYHFTTLTPNLGVVKRYDKTFVLADIPGLIEGAAEGAGLGHDFLRHIERTRVLVHVIDVSGSEGRDPVDDYFKIKGELTRYSARLGELKQVVAANKMDITGAEDNLARLKEALKDEGVEVFPVSAATVTGFDALIDCLVRTLATLPKTYQFEEEEINVGHKYEPGFNIERDGDVFVVTGGSVDYILDTTYADDEGSMRRFQQYLIKEGIIDALRAAGANENSVVRMGDWEFDFVE